MYYIVNLFLVNACIIRKVKLTINKKSACAADPQGYHAGVWGCLLASSVSSFSGSLPQSLLSLSVCTV